MAEADLDAEFAEQKMRAEAMSPEYPEISLKSLLEETPPDRMVYAIDLEFVSNGVNWSEAPCIALYCESETCLGQRQFESGDHLYFGNHWQNQFLSYKCRNCKSREVYFALRYRIHKPPTYKEVGRGIFVKLGQFPAFGPQTSSKLISLIGPDRDIFLQGRRAENRGMGVGAFAYYRRVVENQKNRIILKISEVAKLVGSTPEADALFAAALAETQFSKSIDKVKDLIPQTLLIAGKNPLLLLHSALSKGLHDSEMTDDHCLALAKSIRTVLVELAERASSALKDDQQIQSALNVLMGASKVKVNKL
jgi:hypothetical protein